MPFSPLNSGFLSLILATYPKMQSQNTPSPQNKIEMKSTNLIFILLLLRFWVFLLLQSSVFAFCLYSSCLFGFCHWYPKRQNQKKSKASLRAFPTKSVNFCTIWRMNSNFYLYLSTFSNTLSNRLSISFSISFKYYFFIHYLLFF